jgi:hypothetical protein
MKLADQVDLFTADLAKWYNDHQVPRAFHMAHPKVVTAAGQLCNNNWRMCVIDADGSITVYNRSQW